MCWHCTDRANTRSCWSTAVQHSLTWPGRSCCRCSAAVASRPQTGMATFPEDGTSPQALVSRACGRLRGEDRDGQERASVVLNNPGMRSLYATVDKVAPGAINVLITGETGVGKEILAQTVHRDLAGPISRSSASTARRCRESLLESELFGSREGAVHRRGAGQAGAAGGGRGRDGVPRRGGRDVRSACRPSCCGPSRAARCCGWAPPGRGRSTCASWRPPTGTSRRRWRRGASGRTCTSGSTASR